MAYEVTKGFLLSVSFYRDHYQLTEYVWRLCSHPECACTGADPGFLKGGGVQHSQAPPPPLDIVRVMWSALRKIEKHNHSWTFTKGGGPTLGPMLKSLHRGPKGGGSGPPGPPPWIRHYCTCMYMYVTMYICTCIYAHSRLSAIVAEVFFIKHLYTGPEYGATGQSKTPSCQSGRLMIKQCAMIQNNLQLGGSIQHIYISKIVTVGQTITQNTQWVRP